jgi:hypothetical protein
VPVKEDKTSKAAEKAWYASDPLCFTEWPRKTLHRFLHAALPTWSAGDNARANAALENVAAPSADECLAGLRSRYRKGTYKSAFQYRDFVWGVEAIVGTDATLDAIVSEMETEDTKYNDRREAMVEATAFMLLRASPTTAKSARTRMERLFAAPRDPTIAHVYEGYFDTLDCVLHGAVGLKRFWASWPTRMDAAPEVCLEIPGTYCGGSLDFAGDSPSFIREAIKTTNRENLSSGMSVRVAALGGSAALALLPTRKWPAVRMPSVVRDFGMLRAPEIVTFMASLVGKSSVKNAPIDWFKAHADYARPILEKTKSPAAKLVLRQLA